jgi:sugar/nucleoside kinase (ribokinase family)
MIDYLVIGHISSDRTPTGSRVGGTVAYAGRTARSLGCRTAMLTSASAADDYAGILPGIDVHTVAADVTTVFENIYASGTRRQILHSRAENLFLDHLPAHWRTARIVHFAPIADEIDPRMISQFPEALIGLTPQGWMRGWDRKGNIFARDWEAAPEVSPSATTVILSEEDLPSSQALDRYRCWCPLLVLTCGNRGCKVFRQDDMRHVPVAPVQEADPTGAGDIFAAAFLIRLHRNNGDPWDAARFANGIAAATVKAVGLEAKIDAIDEFMAKQQSCLESE